MYSINEKEAKKRLVYLTGVVYGAANPDPVCVASSEERGGAGATSEERTARVLSHECPSTKLLQGGRCL